MKDFSYQLYSSRNFGPLPETLAMVARAGYTQVEGYGGLFTPDGDLGALRAALDANGLTMPTAHVGLDMMREYPCRVNELIKVVDLKAIFGPYLAAEERPSDSASWRTFGEGFAELAKIYQDQGVTVGWHNHDFELQPTPSGDLPLDLMLDGNDLALEFDVAWAVVAGRDPVADVARYGDRLHAVHVKDIAAPGTKTDEDGWADVGAGTMPWAEIMAAARKTDAAYFIAEHDNPSDDTRFATASLAAMRGY